MLASLLVVLFMTFHQGSSFNCYQCTSSLFEGCDTAPPLEDNHAACDGGFTRCATVSTIINDVVVDVSRQCTASETDGCVNSTPVDNADGTQSFTQVCTVTCGTDACNNGLPPAPPTEAPTPAPTEPAPVETEPPVTEPPVAPETDAPEPEKKSPGGSAAGLKMSFHVFLSALVLSAVTAMFHM